MSDHKVAPLLLTILLFSSFCTLRAQEDPNRRGRDAGHVLHVTIPSDISRDEVASADSALKARLHGLAKQQLRSQGRSDTHLVIFVDQHGIPILPDLEAARKRARTTPNELTFTYYSPDYAWSTEEISALNAYLSVFYPTIKAVYGNPAFNISINVLKDPGIISAGLYYASLNEIVLPNVSEDVFCHEVIHAFRDDDIISLSSFEEGMTRAAEVEVLARPLRDSYWDAHHGYAYDVYYEALNRNTIGSLRGNFFLGYIGTLLRYQLAGYAWGKIVLENPRFLPDFNAALYRSVLADQFVTSTESKLVAIADRVQSKVEAKPFLAWYRQQGVLNTAPPTGFFLYQRVNQFTVDFFRRDASGTETMQANASVEWAVFDYQDALLTSGTETTSASGWMDIPVLPPGYIGRIKVVVNASSPEGPVTDTALRTIGNEAGVFGVVADSVSGDLAITPMDERARSVTVNVTNGAFSAPSLESVRGRFRAVFTSADDRRLTKVFTKDRSNYFLLMAP